MKTQDLLRGSGRNTSQRCSVPFEYSTRHRRVGGGVEAAAPTDSGSGAEVSDRGSLDAWVRERTRGRQPEFGF